MCCPSVRDAPTGGSQQLRPAQESFKANPTHPIRLPKRSIHRHADRPPRQATTLRSIKSLVPLLDRVLVQRVKAETKTASGIFLPESSVKELNEAKVLAVGPGALDKDGKRVPMGVSAGDKVLIPQVCWTSGYSLDLGRRGC